MTAANSPKPAVPTLGSTFVTGANDSENAKMFLADRREQIRYVAEWKGWLTKDPRTERWGRDTPEATRIGNKIESWAAAKLAQAKALYPVCEAGDEEDKEDKAERAKARAAFKWAAGLGDVQGVNATKSLARNDPGILAEVDRIDSDPWLLGVANGILDLRTKERVQPQGVYITKTVPVAYDPEAECPRWEKFLLEIMSGNEELVGFLRRSIGYSLCGLAQEKVIYFLYGGGDNGKSLFLNVLHALFGEGASGYGGKASKKLYAQSRNTEYPFTELAAIHGCRFVSGSEVSEDDAMNEDVLKDMSGGDSVVARHLFGHPFVYTPQCTIWLYGNHRLRVKGGDEALWRRMRCIPFLESFPLGDPRRDEGLQRHLIENELPGILRWAVDACCEWREKGLMTPALVTETVQEYREDNDPLGSFIDEKLVFSAGGKVKHGEVYQAYRNWAADEGISFVMTKASLTRKLKERLKGRVGEGLLGKERMRGFLGLSVRGSDTPDVSFS